MKILSKLTALLLMLILLVAAPVAMATETQSADDDKLQELMEIAEMAKEENYTAESWQDLEDAMELANAAQGGDDDEAMKNAISALATALSKLTSMKYAALDEALAEARAFLKENKGQWPELEDAIAAAEATYGCGDQNAVDQAVKDLKMCLEVCRAGGSGGDKTQNQDGSQKNSTVLWIILICAAVVVLAGAAVAVWLILRNKSNRNKQVDDVPLVEYDIDDDFM